MPDVDALKHWAPGGPGQEEPLRQQCLLSPHAYQPWYRKIIIWHNWKLLKHFPFLSSPTPPHTKVGDRPLKTSLKSPGTLNQSSLLQTHKRSKGGLVQAEKERGRRERSNVPSNRGRLKRPQPSADWGGGEEEPLRCTQSVTVSKAEEIPVQSKEIHVCLQCIYNF